MSSSLTSSVDGGGSDGGNGGNRGFVVAATAAATVVPPKAGANGSDHDHHYYDRFDLATTVAVGGGGGGGGGGDGDGDGGTIVATKEDNDATGAASTVIDLGYDRISLFCIAFGYFVGTVEVESFIYIFSQLESTVSHPMPIICTHM